MAVPAPFKVAVTMQATVTTDLSASQTHIAAGAGACGFVDVNGSSQRTIQFATPTPIVLSMSELTRPRPGRLLPGFNASSIATGAFTETFSSPCSDNTCDITLTPAQLEQRLAKGHALVVRGSDVHYFPAFEGIVTQQSAWTFRIVRAR